MKKVATKKKTTKTLKPKKSTKIKGLEEYKDDELDLDEDYEELDLEDEEEVEEKPKKKKKSTRRKSKKQLEAKNAFIRKIINAVFGIIVVLLIMTAVDVIAVARYDSGPFFAINLKTYKDGGTKVYYGLGYKVINYNVTEGRKGKVVGSWFMPYSTVSTKIDVLDLALEFERDKNAVSNKFYNQYLAVVGEISKLDETNKLVEIEYVDVDGKYTLLVKGHLTDEVIMASYKEGEKVHLLGTAKVFKAKTETEPNTIELEGCFIKGIIE